MNKFAVTLPNGRTATRTSQNRTYTHAVATRTPAAVRVARLRRDAKQLTEHAVAYRANQSPSRPNEDLFARWGVDKVIGWAEANETKAANQTAEADRIEAAVEHSEWGVAGWCGREDLAVKLAAKEAKYGHETLIIAV